MGEAIDELSMASQDQTYMRRGRCPRADCQQYKHSQVLLHSAVCEGLQKCECLNVGTVADALLHTRTKSKRLQPQQLDTQIHQHAVGSL
jgi:hypothetical protein